MINLTLNFESKTTNTFQFNIPYSIKLILNFKQQKIKKLQKANKMRIFKVKN